jgi:hypothetical protein
VHQQERDLCDAWPNAAQPAATMEEALRRMSETAIDYTTHILIGVKKSGEMTVLAQWPRVPRQADVDGKIQSAKEPYIKFVLCTPTSIMGPPGASPQRRLWS